MSGSEPSAGAPENLSELAEFEGSLDELELLVAQMESGDLSLEESLQAFERGVALTRSCQQALKTAELRVQALTVDASKDEIPNTEDSESDRSSAE